MKLARRRLSICFCLCVLAYRIYSFLIVFFQFAFCLRGDGEDEMSKMSTTFSIWVRQSARDIHVYIYIFIQWTYTYEYMKWWSIISTSSLYTLLWLLKIFEYRKENSSTSSYVSIYLRHYIHTCIYPAFERRRNISLFFDFKR